MKMSGKFNLSRIGRRGDGREVLKEFPYPTEKEWERSVWS